MCCRSNGSSRGCGCGCGSSGGSSCGCACGCGSSGGWGSTCGCWGVDNGAVALPSFPDCSVCESIAPDSSAVNFPVYVSMPATMSRGSANLRAAVDLDRGCPYARG